MSSEGHSRDCALSATGIAPTGTIWCVGFQYGERLHGIREVVLGARTMVPQVQETHTLRSEPETGREGGAAHFPRVISHDISSFYPRPKPTVRVSPKD